MTHRVLDEVREHLLEAVRIGPQRADLVGDVDHERVPSSAARHPALHLRLDPRPHVEGLGVDGQPAGVDA